MDFSNYNIGLGITGSFCTFAKARKEIQRLCDMGANVVPVFSFNAQTCDTRFGSAKDYVDGICEITGNEGIRTICAAEPIGPNNFLDIMVIAPCTGNTAAKLCNGITDTPVLMATKAHMRNGKPLVIAISTNDALGAHEYEKYLFRSVRAGQLQEQAELHDRKNGAPAGHNRGGARRQTDPADSADPDVTQI